MRACAHIDACMCLRMHTLTCVHSGMHAHARTLMRAHICMHTHSHSHAHTHTHVHTHTHTHTYTHTHTQTHTHTHAYTHTHTHMHIHTHTHTHSEFYIPSPFNFIFSLTVLQIFSALMTCFCFSTYNILFHKSKLNCQ